METPAERPAGRAAEDAARVRLPEPPADLRPVLDAGGAIVWSEPLTIRTYATAPPSRYPMYLDRRVYQGSSGTVYPLPFVEGVADEGHPQTWDAIHLENAYLRIVLLPQLGGRVYIGYDKTTGYDFFYRNNVIKPALVGLAGPWLSGGVEFNWPQHHRPATYLPVDTSLEREDDGSVTAWCGDHEPFARMASAHGVRLRPDSSVLELRVRLHNRTPERQTFLWWANVAARVHDDYQSFFPTDVSFVADHARRALTAFPAADRPYYGVDYPARAARTPGADRIDWYRNIPVPTSYMIVDSEQDFFGGYDHAADAGFVHWAERRLSPGKKQWTWGDAPFGHAWDDQLTDADGPYVELMAGVYTDNQPDFSWLLPGETRAFSQYWYPIPAIGPAHQATPDAAVHVDADGAAGAGGGGVRAVFAVTRPQPGARLRLSAGGRILAEATRDLVPGVPAELVAEVAGAEAADAAELTDASGRLLVAWTPTPGSPDEPWVATEPPAPADLDSVEELYLTGLHLTQNRHPTRSPLPYWREALRRDPGHSATNVALGERAYRRGEYAAALDHARVATRRLTGRNGNPEDCRALHLEGLALRRLGRSDEAARAFGKAGWDGALAGASGFELAQLLAGQGRDRAALRVLDGVDAVAGADVRRPALRAILLRRAGRPGEAETVLADALRVDPLDATLRVLAGDEEAGRSDAGTLLDVGLDLAKAGAIDEALGVFRRAAALPATDAGNLRPITNYVAALVAAAAGRGAEASTWREAARDADRTWAFPAGLDQYDALMAAAAADPDDAVARSLLGMLLYASGRRREARAWWEEAIELGLADPVLLRNAGLAAYNIAGDDELAARRYAEAVSLAPDDARLLFEADQLAARLGRPAAERLAVLRAAETLVLGRDDVTIEYVGLLTACGEAARAREILATRTFHPWEGGEGRAVEAWDAACRALGVDPGDPPANLGEARAEFAAPAAVRPDGATDYFATSLPELLLFHRESGDDEG